MWNLLKNILWVSYNLEVIKKEYVIKCKENTVLSYISSKDALTNDSDYIKLHTLTILKYILMNVISLSACSESAS